MSDDINHGDKLATEIKLLSYKFEVMEKKLDDQLDKLSLKLDELIGRISLVKEKQALDSQAIEQTNRDIVGLNRRVNSLEDEVVNVKVGMAKKLAFGGLGGALVVGMLKLFEFGIK